MLRTRIILIVVCVLLVWGLFLLPKAVVENSSQLESGATRDSAVTKINATPHSAVSAATASRIKDLRARYLSGSGKEKNAIFADSLAILYKEAGRFDSAAWFAEEESTFLNTPESFLKAGNSYYDAFTFAVNPQKQKELAAKVQLFFGKVLAVQPANLEVKTRLAMTYVSSSSPMRGILMLREVLAQDPKNESALYSMGMLSVQSGQFDRAIERLLQLIAVNPRHMQGQLLLGVAYRDKGEKVRAREQFEKVKKMDGDPAVQAAADSYLKDLK
jgi:tetratricopeptide (TPR) repeat protein